VFSGTLNPTQSIIYKDQLLLTNPRDTLPHGKMKEGGRCVINL